MHPLQIPPKIHDDWNDRQSSCKYRHFPADVTVALATERNVCQPAYSTLSGCLGKTYNCMYYATKKRKDRYSGTARLLT